MDICYVDSEITCSTGYKRLHKCISCQKTEHNAYECTAPNEILRKQVGNDLPSTKKALRRRLTLLLNRNKWAKLQKPVGVSGSERPAGPATS